MSHRDDDRRLPRRRSSLILAVVLTVALLGLVGAVVVHTRNRASISDAQDTGSSAAGAPAVGPGDLEASYTPSTSADQTALPMTSPPTTGTEASAGVHTPQGMWWGVDSTSPISATTVANVRAWYQGRPRPQFWGRYLGGRYGVTRTELAYARTRQLYVYLIVSDLNCSSCAGGDLCGNDQTQAQAQTDARTAVERAHRLALPERTTLFKDFEQVSSCRGEPTAEYLLGWYHALASSGFRAGFYGNVHEQFFDFPAAYCRALTRDPSMGTTVTLAMNEDEPLIGAPKGSTGPHNAPRFQPKSPRCAPTTATAIWQYGESLTTANLTDVDQARPDTPGLLAPNGTATP